MTGLSAIPGVERAFSGPVFHEFVLRLQTPARASVASAAGRRAYSAGCNLAQDYPELGQALLVCATETKNADDLKRYTENLARIVGKHFRPAPCALKPSSN